MCCIFFIYVISLLMIMIFVCFVVIICGWFVYLLMMRFYSFEQVCIFMEVLVYLYLFINISNFKICMKIVMINLLN